MFQHRHAIGGGEGYGSAGAALTDDHGDHGNADLQAFLGRPRDGLRLAAFLGALAGVGARRVHERDDRQAETVGEVHQADCLAIAFGTGHAEIVVDARLGVVALFMAHDHDRLVLKPCQTAQNCAVVGKVAIAGQRRVFGEQRLDIVRAMRSVRMARDLAFPPGRQVLVHVRQQGLGLLVEGPGLFFQIHIFFALRGECTQFRSFAFYFGKRLFELEIILHPGGAPVLLNTNICREPVPIATTIGYSQIHCRSAKASCMRATASTMRARWVPMLNRR